MTSRSSLLLWRPGGITTCCTSHDVENGSGGQKVLIASLKPDTHEPLKSLDRVSVPRRTLEVRATVQVPLHGGVVQTH